MAVSGLDLGQFKKMTEESGLLLVPGCLKLAYVCRIKTYATYITKMRCGRLSSAFLLILVLWQEINETNAFVKVFLKRSVDLNGLSSTNDYSPALETCHYSCQR